MPSDQMKQPSQQQQGSAAVLQQRKLIKTLITDPAFFDALPDHCQARVNLIVANVTPSWSDSETAYMCSMALVALYWDE